MQTLPVVSSLGSGLSISTPYSSARAFLDFSAWLGLSGLPRAGIWVCRDSPGHSRLSALSPGTYPCTVE